MHKGIAVFFGQFYCFGISFVINIAVQHHISAIGFGRIYFDQWCYQRHNNSGFDTHLGSSQCYTLGMVSGGRSNNALGTFFFSQICDFVICAANFKGTCSLQVFWLNVNSVASLLTEKITVNQFCFPQHAVQIFCSFADIVQMICCFQVHFTIFPSLKVIESYNSMEFFHVVASV